MHICIRATVCIYVCMCTQPNRPSFEKAASTLHNLYEKRDNTCILHCVRNIYFCLQYEFYEMSIKHFFASSRVKFGIEETNNEVRHFVDRFLSFSLALWNLIQFAVLLHKITPSHVSLSVCVYVCTYVSGSVLLHTTVFYAIYFSKAYDNSVSLKRLQLALISTG